MSYKYRKRYTPSLKTIQNSIMKKAVRETKIEQMKGNYSPSLSNYNKRNMAILSFNNCFVCMMFSNKAYFGKKAVELLDAQNKFQPDLATDISAISTAIQVSRFISRNNNINFHQDNNDPIVNFSYGKVPYDGDGICERDNISMVAYLFDFFSKNLFGLSDEDITRFIDNMEENEKRIVMETRQHYSIANAPVVFEMNYYEHFSQNFIPLLKKVPWTPDYRDNMGSWNQLRSSPNVEMRDNNDGTFQRQQAARDNYFLGMSAMAGIARATGATPIQRHTNIQLVPQNFSPPSEPNVEPNSEPLPANPPPPPPPQQQQPKVLIPKIISESQYEDFQKFYNNYVENSPELKNSKMTLQDAVNYVARVYVDQNV